MEVHEKITEIVTMVDSARTMPMSSTAMVNKQQLLVLLDEVRECLPENLRAAEAVLGQREALLVEARGNAEKVVAEARDEHARLVDDHSVTQAARIEADEILRVAHDQAQAIRDDADDYVDAKLARLEVAAQRIVETVRDGREQLQHPTPFDELAHRRNGHELERGVDDGAEVEAGGGVGAHGGAHAADHAGHAHAADRAGPAADDDAHEAAGVDAAGVAGEAAVAETRHPKPTS